MQTLKNVDRAGEWEKNGEKIRRGATAREWGPATRGEPARPPQGTPQVICVVMLAARENPASYHSPLPPARHTPHTTHDAGSAPQPSAMPASELTVGAIRPHALTRAGLERRAVRQRAETSSAHKQNENRLSGHNGLNRSRRPRASWTSGRRSRRRTRHVAPSAPTPRTLPRWRPPRLGQARRRRAAAAPWLGFGFGLG